MHTPSSPINEPDRLNLLRSLGILDTVPEPSLDRITRTAARVFQMPVVLVTLIDDQRQWFMSRVGLDLCETPRRDSICGHAILETSTMVVPDALLDARFHDNPLVRGSPYIRFYAGRPLRSKHGLALGTLCLIDQQPRHFSADDHAALNDLADMVEAHFHGIEAATEANAVKAALKRNEILFARTITHAAVGIAVATTDGRWLEVNQRFCDIVGHPRQQLIGGGAFDIVHPDDIEPGRDLFLCALQGKTDALNLEVRFVRADGSHSWTQVGASVLLDERGHPENLITVVTDINRRKLIQGELEALQRTLEQRIVARTAELKEVVGQLKGEIAIRESVQRALTDEKERFQSTLRNASDAFIQVDRNDRIVSWNLSAERIFGWSNGEAIGRSLSETIVPPMLRDRHLTAFHRFIQSGTNELIKQHMELTGLRRNGEVFPLELTLSTSHAGGELWVNAFLHDISRRKADEHALRESSARLKTITDNVPAMIAFLDRDLRYRFHNHAYVDWFGVQPDSLVGTDAREFWGAAAYEGLRPALAAVLHGESVTVEYQLPALTGLMWFYANLVPHIEDDGSITGFYLLAQDITERKQLYELIEHEAAHDALTGLPNRRALMLRLDEAMARVRRHHRPMAVLFMDLDGFKQMNDTLGHEFGDAVMQHFAATVSAAVRETDFVARLAGDEFVVVLEDLASDFAGQAGSVAWAVLERLRTDQEIQGVEVTLAASIGAAVYADQDEETAQELLNRADAAMYRAKAAGKGRLSF